MAFKVKPTSFFAVKRRGLLEKIQHYLPFPGMEMQTQKKDYSGASNDILSSEL
jgi:hypothetical protein